MFYFNLREKHLKFLFVFSTVLLFAFMNTILVLLVYLAGLDFPLRDAPFTVLVSVCLIYVPAILTFFVEELCKLIYKRDLLFARIQRGYLYLRVRYHDCDTVVKIDKNQIRFIEAVKDSEVINIRIIGDNTEILADVNCKKVDYSLMLAMRELGV